MIDGETPASNADRPASEPAASDEFDAAVSELLDGKEGAPPDMGSAVETTEEAPDSSAETSAPATPPEGDPAPGEEVASVPAAPDGADAPPPASNTTDDIWANADPKLREAHEKALRTEQYRTRTWEGRTESLKARIRELERGQPRQQQGQPAQDGGGTTAEPAKGPLSAEALAKLREDYSELGPVFDMLQTQQGEIEKLSKGVGAIEQHRIGTELTRQEHILTEAHPDWLQAASDDRFQGWLASKPAAIQEAFKRNHDAIVDGADAALVIGMFKADVGFGAPAPAPTPAPTPAPAPAPSEKRQKQLASGRDAGGTAIAVTSGVPDDVEGAANFFLDRAAARV